MAFDFTIDWDNPLTFQWTLTDASGAGITGATVSSTLYKGRSWLHPDRKPGVAVTGWTDVALVEQGAGVYSVNIAAADLPVPGFDYVLVVESLFGNTVIDHSEEPTRIVVES